MNATVHVVHCVDTEGPLHESLEATFERIRRIFHLDLEPSQEMLKRLQAGEVELDGLEEAVQRVVDPRVLDYNDTWDKLDTMLDEALSAEYRSQFPDHQGRGWIYNWFCLDHVEYKTNPRRRTMGYHAIFDHYRRRLERLNADRDGLHFHYHPQPFRKHAHLCATHWWASSHTLFEVLSRRIIDRNWFPSANRPGFQVNRPDSHWFLEQYIPFDFASLAMEPDLEDEQQFDFSKGRSGDWRRAPRTWTPYHPSHDDYQREGSCRRWIARCLNIGTRSYLLRERHVQQAFKEARKGKPVVLSFNSHDFRDIRRDVEEVHEMLERVSAKYPEVVFRHSEAVSAMRRALGLPSQSPCDLKLNLSAAGEDAHVLRVRSETPTFGPQPFLAIKTVTDSYYHDNLDFQVPDHEWSYVFDHETFPLRAVEAVGVAANNAYGVTTVSVLDVASGEITTRHLNRPG